MSELSARFEWGLVPAVPVPFRGTELDMAAQRRYAAWMAARPVAGVAVWAYTGRGSRLTTEQRRDVLACWRDALPGRLVIAGANDVGMAIQARRAHADLLLAMPQRDDPVGYHRRLSGELPTIASYVLNEAAGGIAYDDATLDAILNLPNIIGLKVTTLDSVMTFQRLSALVARHPGKLLISGEERFLGYSLMLGARAALVGLGAALTDIQAELLHAFRDWRWGRFMELNRLCDAFAHVAFVPPIEGYIQRLLWAAAAEGALPRTSCDDPWGPKLPDEERTAVEEVVRLVRPSRS